MTMQTLVLAHCMGHSHFFKNNFLFKQWTHADYIIDYMKFAKSYIARCEEKYGIEAVEETLDAAHSLQMISVDRYKRPSKPTKNELYARAEERQRDKQKATHDVWKIIKSYEVGPDSYLTPSGEISKQLRQQMLPEPEENLLYFLEKKSPVLKTWQRELLRIVRKLGQYFYPQMQTKVGNEGFACFTHYYIMHRMYEKGQISDGNLIEALANHANVVLQPMPDFRTQQQKASDRLRRRPELPQYSGFNPYALGFAIMQDVKRMCENPTAEDKEWFPNVAGTDWKTTVLDVVANYRDESMIRQFLSPKVIRDLRLFSLNSDEANSQHYEVTGIHNDAGYRKVRKTLSETYDINMTLPNIQVVDVDIFGTNKLMLKHYGVKNKILADDSIQTLKYLRQLWGYDIVLSSVDENGTEMEVYDTESLSW